MKLRIFTFFCLVLLSSCIKKDFSTNYKAYFINASGHEVDIYTYTGSFITDSLHLGLMDSLIVAEGTKWGIDLQDGFQSDYMGDSVLVIFDDSLSTIHYTHQEMDSTRACYEYSSPRNITNQDNFQFTYRDENRYHRISTYSYTFLLQDYQYSIR